MLEPGAEYQAFLKEARAVAGNVKQIYWKLKPEPVKIPKRLPGASSRAFVKGARAGERHLYYGSQEPGAGLFLEGAGEKHFVLLYTYFFG